MKEFYVTFGDRYRRESHPVCGWVHPDGYLVIEATDHDTARQAAFNVTGGKFAFMYQDQPDLQYFPLGEIMRIRA